MDPIVHPLPLSDAGLVLRPFEEQDREPMLRLLSDSRITETYMVPAFQNRQEADAFFSRLMELSRTRFVYGIYLDGTPVGMLNVCGTSGDEMELGYFIDPLFQGKGLATRALSLAIQEAFRIGYSLVTAGYFEGNAASRRVMEKCGMKLLDRESGITWHGITHRCLYMGISCR